MPRQQSRGVAACAAASAALADLMDLQTEYQEWRDNLPENLDSSPVAEKLDTVLELDLQLALETVEEAENVELPQGFGRD